MNGGVAEVEFLLVRALSRVQLHRFRLGPVVDPGDVGDERLTASFVEDVLVRYTIASK